IRASGRVVGQRDPGAGIARADPVPRPQPVAGSLRNHRSRDGDPGPSGPPVGLVADDCTAPPRALMTLVTTSGLSPLLLVVWRRSGACIARPTRKGYRVVSRPRRTPRGAC